MWFSCSFLVGGETKVLFSVRGERKNENDEDDEYDQDGAASRSIADSIPAAPSRLAESSSDINSIICARPSLLQPDAGTSPASSVLHLPSFGLDVSAARVFLLVTIIIIIVTITIIIIMDSIITSIIISMIFSILIKT